MGPVLIFDKSSLQGLSLDEAVWLEAYFCFNITPVFFIETLADLSKRATTADAEDVVADLARKTPIIDHGDGVEVAPDGTILLGGTTETANHVFARGPTKTSRLRGTVATPGNALQDVAGSAVDAGGTAATPAGTSPSAGGFDATLVRVGP